MLLAGCFGGGGRGLRKPGGGPRGGGGLLVTLLLVGLEEGDSYSILGFVNLCTGGERGLLISPPEKLGDGFNSVICTMVI